MNKRALSHNTSENVDRLFSDVGYVKDYHSPERLSWYAKMIDLFADEANIDFMDHQIVDVGCGTGYALRYLHENYDHGSLYGYDYSSVALDIARGTLPIGTFILHDLNEPIDRSFDIILGLEVFEHLHYPDAVLANLRGILRDDGLMFITIPYGPSDKFWGHIHRWSLTKWMDFSGASLAGISDVKRSRTAGPVIWSILEKES